MFYLVEDFFTDRNQQILLESLERMELDYKFFKLVPFIDKFEFEDSPKEGTFMFGSVKAARFLHCEGFTPGSLYNENHDFEVYGPIYGSNMLNHGAHLMNFEDSVPEDDKWQMFFARPCGDTKLFTGQVYMRHSWNEYVSGMLDESKLLFIGENFEQVRERIERFKKSRVMLCCLKNIAREVRCWVVGGKVITMSEYKLGTRVVYKNVDHEDWLRDIVQGFVDIYQPAEAFVIDVCEVFDEKWQKNSKISIVEINCINAAGFYEANMQVLLNSLEEHFNLV